MPAALNAEKFVRYFGNEKTTHFTLSIFSMALMIAKDIHDKERYGDILVFFQSVEEVEEVCNLLRKEIVYVIDLGKSKKSDSNPRMGLESLLKGPISQAAARKRAGRIKPGFCYRLYTHYLSWKAMGFDDVAHFDFIMDNRQWLFNIFLNQRVLEEATNLGSTTTQGTVLLVVRLENEM
ncbi:pre-mRNA-splicing factor ATP-dependent RNA helicase prp43 [Fusarium subglutinans]|uniref:Pre-mRNA-splicing factor ATP-dependent RNA helicase prp43 n=1 Tax=Gibberella subglutinans TaxID=42677 RepID=A0A8H5KZM3_GIBSU|nr:pre-mRNA-splicing factor ATP-dependent RNA helicase prp43 [Fusarium subglutinans]KAF5583590.1 pre-mRNA-splicing factor ATP-dependent RNA helicase prp43 [Fusarium subglutinans]